MAITFSDLHTGSGLKSLDDFLSGKSYISGDRLTKDDIKVYAAVLKNPGDSFPNVSRWYKCVSSHLATSFPGKAVGIGFGGKAAPVESAKAEHVVRAMSRIDILLSGDKDVETLTRGLEDLRLILSGSSSADSNYSSIHPSYGAPSTSHQAPLAPSSSQAARPTRVTSQPEPPAPSSQQAAPPIPALSQPAPPTHASPEAPVSTSGAADAARSPFRVFVSKKRRK